MKKHLLLILSISLLTSWKIDAQSISKKVNLAQHLAIQNNTSVPFQRNCGTMENLAFELQKDPALQKKMEKMEEELQEEIAVHQQHVGNKTSTVYKIPVVVHVVYKSGTENVSDAQIYSQIAALNRDYRKQNTDISQVPAAFAALAADAEIEFCLASVDPNGIATTGITRTLTNNTQGFGNPTPSVKTAPDGVSPWDPSRYMNMWVCDLQGQLLGYAQFPGTGSASTDGIVIDFAYFGTMGTATAPFDKGRTATHEVGHYLNLRHIWGDANCGNDFVNDTPTQQASNGQCPTFPHVTCSNGPNGDMFMNYMDYVDDACMFMFSEGQKARMVATLTGTGSGSRASLLTNTNVNCSTPSQVLSCDTIANFTASTPLALYRPSHVGQPGTGYLSGTNSWGDIGFAEKFNALQPLQKIYGAQILFGYGYGFSNATLNAKVWKADGVGGTPGTTLATKTLVLSDIFADITAGNPTNVTFTNPIAINSGSYFIGIEFNNNTIDTIALYTTSNGSVTTGKAYEGLSDGSWYPFTDNTNSWGLNLGLAIAPALCIDYTGIATSTQNSDAIQLFPNPSNGNISLASDEFATEKVDIKVFNSVGSLVLNLANVSANGKLITVDLSGYPQGLYIFEIATKEHSYTKRLNLIH
ncbi:MAG: T9SS type A sorting domain-containing protein [Bacteroidetes bacterium]|nr:T9SS type A sorting domain-containing protein [Bacteroidota bacterium]